MSARFAALVVAMLISSAKGDGAKSVAAPDPVSAPDPEPAPDPDPVTAFRRAAEPLPPLPPRERCHRLPNIRRPICDGPRHAPMPSIAAAERSDRLGLGGHDAADLLVLRPPPQAWVDEIGSPPPRDLLWPVAHGLFSRGFGVDRIRESSQGTHPGVDIVEAEGAPLRAVADALVAYADNGVRGMGNALFLVHADASVSIYAHCRALRVAAGELVRRGEIVGELGATGLTARAHLHYEWRVGGRPRDPMPRFVERPDESLRVERDGQVTWRPPPPNVRDP